MERSAEGVGMTADSTKTWSVFIQGGEVKVLADGYTISSNGALEFYVIRNANRYAVASFASWRWVIQEGQLVEETK